MTNREAERNVDDVLTDLPVVFEALKMVYCLVYCIKRHNIFAAPMKIDKNHSQYRKLNVTSSVELDSVSQSEIQA